MKNASAREKATSFRSAGAVSHTIFTLNSKNADLFPAGERDFEALPAPFSFGGGRCECPLRKTRIATMAPSGLVKPIE
jgi:hypothetical protein